MSTTIQLQVNGAAHSIEAGPDESLLTVLRDDLGLTGAKYGCGEGQCGACTVLIDGRMTRSCITPVGVVGGGRITTIEGLARDDRLHPLQQAFLDADAMQCGYCTAGMIMSGADLLSRNADPSDAEIVKFMNGNVCRCGTYPRILHAIHAAATAMKGGSR